MTIKNLETKSLWNHQVGYEDEEGWTFWWIEQANSGEDYRITPPCGDDEIISGPVAYELAKLIVAREEAREGVDDE